MTPDEIELLDALEDVVNQRRSITGKWKARA